MNVGQFDEISRAIGKIEGEFKAFATQTSTDVASIRGSLETIVRNMHNLPPSDICRQTHEELRSDISDIKAKGARHSGFIAGASATGVFVLQWVLSHLGISFGGK